MDIAIDFETYKYNNEDQYYYPVLENPKYAVLGCMMTDRRKKPYFFDMTKGNKEIIEQLIKLIDSETKRRQKITIWMHNANFDFSILARGLIQDTSLFKPISLKPFIYQMISPNRVINDKGEEIQGKARIIDAMNIYDKMSLAKVGEILGYPKGSMPKKVKFIGELNEYCKRDTEITLKSIKFFRKTMKKLDFTVQTISTIAKTSYALLQKGCSKLYYCKRCEKSVENVKVYKVKINGEDRTKVMCLNCKNEANSYYSYMWYKGSIHQTKEPEFVGNASRGGRAEMFTKTDTRFEKGLFKVDINSQYPHVCCENVFPDVLTERTINNPNRSNIDELGVSEVTIKAPVDEVPYLPIRYKKVIYPTRATMRSIWTNFEIKNAIEKYGYELIKVHKSVVYKPLPFNPFKQHFNKLYELKRNTKGGFKTIIKLLMNSPTGRFAFKVNDRVQEIIKTNEVQQYNSLGFEVISNIEGTNKWIVQKEGKVKRYGSTANPVIYAYITAYGRDMLYEFMRKIPFKELVYCATDSITFKNKDNLKHFKISNELGDWKIERYDDDGEFYSENQYRIGNEIRASGFRKKNVSIEHLRKERTLIDNKMFTTKQAWRTGEFHKVGTFVEQKVELKRNPKRKIKYPKYIEELPQSRYKSVEEIMKECTQSAEST
jgi:hypothetical protein